jgi:hypothetical protein
MIEYTVKVYDNGDVWWLRDDELHREGGPAVEHANGGKQWYLNGELHREDGPACEYPSGDVMWCLNGKLHREDGPAIEYPDGRKSWYLNDKQVTEEEHAEQTAPANAKKNSNNKSGITGVYNQSLKNEKQKWMAQIRVDGKLKNFGPFEKKEDAEALERELQWWGDIPVEATPELLEKIKWLEKCMSIASEFVDIRKCQSCKNPYAAGYVCSCGRDNSYSNDDWDKKVKVVG